MYSLDNLITPPHLILTPPTHHQNSTLSPPLHKIFIKIQTLCDLSKCNQAHRICVSGCPFGFHHCLNLGAIYLKMKSVLEHYLYSMKMSIKYLYS